jgi:surface carbohydrate biosynthesis protein
LRADTANQPLAFLPVLTKARELDSRLLLAAVLATRGYRVLVGGRATINAAAAASRGGLYLCPLLAPRDVTLLTRLRARGHALIGWHEEGLVYPCPQWYFRNRMSGEAASRVDAIIAWGAQSAADLARAWPDIHVPVLPLGNPRLDILCQPFRQIYEPMARRLRQRLGPYLLLNTNFDLVNHVDGTDWMLKNLRRRRWHDAATDLPVLERWGSHRRAMFVAFLSGIPMLQAALWETTIVIRPHPSENPEPWRILAAALPRVVVAEPRGAVAPWILGAVAVLHNSCTTAVDAFVLGCPAIAILAAEREMESPLPNGLSRCAGTWREAADLVHSAARGDPWVTEAQDRLAAAHMTLNVEDMSCAHIADLARDLGAENRTGTLAPPIALAGPLLLERARPYARPLLRPTRRRLVDGRVRFDGLSAGEIEAPLQAIGSVMNRAFGIAPYARDAFVVSARSP